MAIDYTAWPQISDVTALLGSTGIVVKAGLTADLKQLRLDAAVRKITRETHRQFIAGQPQEARDFDGTGTGIMEVDDYVSITDIQFFQFPLVATIDISTYFQISQSTFANNKIYILQGPANRSFGYILNFPEGRANIKIVGTWGYGATIPEDVWEAVLYEATANIADANRLGTLGILDEIRDDDVTLKYSEKQISTISGWHGMFIAACERYKRGVRQAIRRNEVPLY